MYIEKQSEASGIEFERTTRLFEIEGRGGLGWCYGPYETRIGRERTGYLILDTDEVFYLGFLKHPIPSLRLKPRIRDSTYALQGHRFVYFARQCRGPKNITRVIIRS